MILQSKFLHFLSHNPFLVLFGSIFGGIALVIFFAFIKKGIAVFFLLFPVFGIVSFICGSDWNDSFVNENGMKGTAVVTQFAPTGTIINDVEEIKYSTLIKTTSGATVESAFYNNNHTFYPKPNLFIPPSVGEIFTVKYIPGDEHNFIICTADSTSPFANQLDCVEALKHLATAQAKYSLDSTNVLFKKEYEKALGDLLNAPCDTNLNMTYREQLQELEK